MATKAEGTTIDIDLGMTYSCVGVWQNDRVEIIPNNQGNGRMPSYFAVTDDQRFIGDAAKNQIAKNPQNTVSMLKSSSVINCPTHPCHACNMKHQPFMVVVSPGDKSMIVVAYKCEEKQLNC